MPNFAPTWNGAPTDQLPIVRFDRKAGEWVHSFTIVTCPPDALCAQLHDRMPVVLGPEGRPVWLGEEPTDPPRLKALLAPYPAESFRNATDGEFPCA